MFKKKRLPFQLVAICLVFFFCITFITGYSPLTAQSDKRTAQEISSIAKTNVDPTGVKPKYIFLFIGDGMSFPQATALGHYNGTVDHNFVGTLDKPTRENIPKAEMPSFVNFPAVGAATTYDASKFITDSASAATAIACSVKTLDGALGVDPYNKRVISIAEQLKAQAGYKIGIVTSVSLDHATPAGFYAHLPNRNSFYEIGLDLIASDFDFFGGGGFKQPTGKDKNQTHLFDLAKQAGYTVANTYEDIKALNSRSGKTIAINPVLDNPGDVAINYNIDRDAGDLALADYVQKAIDVLGEKNNFFIMAEGGKIDWSSHANDAYTTIQEVKDLENAVNVAVAFAKKHPKETLIIVTGDHETGGFTLGYNGTQYDTYLHLLQNQKLSFKRFADEYVQQYRDNKVPFETAMADVKQLFGLMLPNDPAVAGMKNQPLVLTAKEVAQLQEAYAVSMIPYKQRQRDKEYQTTYSMYDQEPFQIVITRILNSRSGLGWTSTAHTGLPVAVYALGTGQDVFNGFYDNTDIAKKIKALVGLR